MHYRNGRPAKNGDEIVSLESGSGKINGVGVLIRAVPGNDFCNGIIANDRTGSFVGAVLSVFTLMTLRCCLLKSL